MVREISEKLHFQVIMNSHIPELIENSDKVFRVQLEQKDNWEI